MRKLRLVICSKCKGIGLVGNGPCSACYGEGYVEKEKSNKRSKKKLEKESNKRGV